MSVAALLGDGVKMPAATAMAATTVDPPSSNDEEDYPNEVLVLAKRAAEQHMVSFDI